MHDEATIVSVYVSLLMVTLVVFISLVAGKVEYLSLFIARSQHSRRGREGGGRRDHREGTCCPLTCCPVTSDMRDFRGRQMRLARKSQKKEPPSSRCIHCRCKVNSQRAQGTRVLFKLIIEQSMHYRVRKKRERK